MRHRFHRFVAAAAAAALTLAVAAGASNGTQQSKGEAKRVKCVLTAHLTSTQLNAKGHVQIKVFDRAVNNVAYKLFVNNKGGLNFGPAHVHGPRPATGIVVDTSFAATTANKIRHRGVTTLANAATTLCDDTKQFYFNVHLQGALSQVVSGDLR